MNTIDTIENGVRVIRYPGGRKPAKWRGDCDYCQRIAETLDPVRGFFPDHDVMPSCRSGGRNHCTCDGCF